jgi:hypothetical protein
MGEQILDVEADGTVQYFDYDDKTDTVTIRREQDLTKLIEANKRAFNEGLVDRKSEFRRVASIPTNAAIMWARLHGIEDYRDIFKSGNEKTLEQMVHDPDMAYFRTLSGTYSFRAR